MAFTNRESRLFASYKALGLVSSEVPAAVHYVPNAKLHAIVCAVGNVVHTYRSRKLALWNVSAPLKAEIRCLAVDSRYVYVGCGRTVIALHFGLHQKHVYDGHSGSVDLLLTFGNHLISVGCSGAELRVWDIETEELFNQTNFDSNTFSISAMCHPNTYLNKVALGSKQGSIKLFNLKTNKLIYEFQGWNSAVTKLEQSPAVDIVAIGLYDGRIYLHNLKLDETLISFKQDWGVVCGITFRTDGPPIMLTSSQQGHVALWDLEKRKLHAQMTDLHSAPVNTLITLQNEPLLITSSGDNSLKMWIFDNSDGTGRLLHVRDGHGKPPTFIRYYGADGSYILSTGADGTVKQFHTKYDHLNKNLGSAGLMRKQVAKKRHINWEDLRLPPCIYLSSNTTRESGWDNVVCCHENHSIATTWTSRKNRLGDHKLCHQRFSTDATYRHVRATCCSVSACGNFGLIGYSSGHVDIFNIQSGLYRGSFVDKTTLSVSDRAHDCCITGICVDGLNRHAVTCCSGGLIKFWNFKNRSLLQGVNVEFGIERCEIYKDNGLLAVALNNYSLLIVDVEFRRVVRRFDSAHSDKITDLTFNHSGHWLCSASLDKTIKIWDLTTSSLIDVIGLTYACLSLTFSPTGDFLATVHEQCLGIFLWASKHLYNPRLSLKPIPLDYRPDTATNLPITVITTTGQSSENTNDVEFVESDDDSNVNYSSPSQLSNDLITLSGLPTPRWANLIDIDLIKERNKPLEPPKKPKQAPFFLPTVAGLAPRFDVSTVVDSTEVDAKMSEAPGNSRIASFASLRTNSEFCSKLETAVSAANFRSAFDTLKQYGPSGIEIEIRNLNPLHGGSPTLMINFLKMIEYVFDDNSDFELANSYLALYLKLHRDILWNKPEDGDAFVDCSDCLRNVLAKQSESWQRLDSLFANSLCLVNYVKSALL